MAERRIVIGKMEWKSYSTYVDPALRILNQLLCMLPEYPLPQFGLLDVDIRFVEMLFRGLKYWEESDDDWHLRSVIGTMVRLLSQTAEEFKVPPDYTSTQRDIIVWKKWSYALQKRIKKLKQYAREICILLLVGGYKCKPCQHDKELFLEYGTKTASFIHFVQENLESLNSKIPLSAPVKQQIDFVSRRLKVFGKFVDPGIIRRITGVKNLGELMSHYRTWANHISCLACLYWIDGMDESLTSTMGTMLFDLRHKTMPPYAPGVVASYFEDTLIPQLLAGYIDFSLEDLVVPLKDDVDILREGLISLLSFVVDPPEEDSDDRELIVGQICAIINELPSLACSIHYDEMKEGNFETTLYAFLQKIASVKAEIRELYAMSPSEFNSPRTTPIGFLDSLLQKLKKMLERKVNLIAGVKHGIQTVWKELALLRPFWQNNMELQNEHEELKALRTRVVNMVYYAAYITKFCSAQSFSVWYGIIYLPSVTEEIKLIKTQLRETKDHQMDKNKMLCAKIESNNPLLPQATTSKSEGAFIGFEEDVRSIINHLARGQKDLTIISISGMPGQGKTTLAKRIYNDPAIQYHFHKMVWCYVPKECEIRDLMIHIVRDVSEDEVKDISKLEIHDLADRLRRRLKGKRYLIVMDDIWDVGTWRQVQGSFPNDKNGSRILFTSRNHNLASEAERNFISHALRLFSEEESWDLMKEKLFLYDGCPPEFLDIGKQIATFCKGLPLAIALIASLLGKTERKLDLWKQAAENLKSHLANEGCMHIIELSYRYLPGHLKSCFLYFGAFPRGHNIGAKRLKLLWIGEGFAEENEKRSSEDLAEEYLDNLVSLNLVVVTERSSLGGIKSCSVHDLLYDLCIEKIGEENFFHWDEFGIVSDGCLPKYSHHRLCIGKSDPLMKSRPLYARKELPTSQVHSLLFSSYCSLSSESFSRVLKSFKVLTVLDLEDAPLLWERFPDVIFSNIHLRYLALPGISNCIPPSIADLWNLEILIMRRWHRFIEPLPDTMWKMESLRRVDIWRCLVHFEDFEGNNNNSYVALRNIETLGGPIVLRDARQTVEFLKRLSRLRKLDCCCESEEWPPTWLSTLEYLKNLEHLKIRAEFFPYSARLPTFNFPQNLKKLSLECLSLPWSAMSTIGKQLPNLEVLKLLDDACEGTTWDLEDVEFPKLRYLKLSDLNIEQINASVVGCDDSFPCLEHLRVEKCYNLEEIPSSFGDICTLNTIKVTRCYTEVSDSARQILEQQREMGNLNFQVFVHRALGRS